MSVADPENTYLSTKLREIESTFAAASIYFLKFKNILNFDCDLLLQNCTGNKAEGIKKRLSELEK